ncbi:lipid A biosynthesis acyltransferase [Usitatibacter palustris]|uniref:Lipid A biosynthesis lauroyltransferase n=1 Tax=Usitatibacter palustris TaxID=2732487 RepID=A0A6M4H971_9PROT|nr:lipid A biosynthesis acyltransferase [Usitatibacter palustris]QJR16289.1 Lipid A biosynthesis lauroyltransferase [Usitatibacter palustris]
MKLIRSLGSWLGVAFLWLLHLLPTRAIAAVGRGFGTLAYRFGRGRVARINLAMCFPDMPEEERNALALAHFKSLGRALAEQSIFWFGRKERAMGMVRIIGGEHFDRLKGTPVIVFAPHFIGLNLGGPKISHVFPGTASIYSTQKNPVLDHYLYQGRVRFGSPKLLSRQEGMRAIVKSLREGRLFYFLPDMDFGARDSIFVPFFGVPTSTVTALPRLARMAGAKVVPTVTRQTEDGYEVTVHPPWENYPSGDVEADVRRMNTFIEEQVRLMPEQYFWAHKRFKTRPPGEPNPYRE